MLNSIIILKKTINKPLPETQAKLFSAVASQSKRQGFLRLFLFLAKFILDYSFKLLDDFTLTQDSNSQLLAR